MKKFKSYLLGAMAVIATATGFTSCQDSFDDPTTAAPVATMTPNAKISDIKELFWDESNNYCVQVGEREDGTHWIISGRVISSDYAGNCFKYIVLQDETGALNFSINSYNLYLNYRRGQEVVVDLTGLYVGKYRGLFQVGFPSFNTSIQGDETSFMAPEFFARNKELNGYPDVAKVDTVVIDNFSELGITPKELRQWQSQIVRFNNVEFVPNSTTPTLSTYHSSGETQTIRDVQGNTLDVRTSGYANFWNMTLPEGRCDVVALLGYYMSLANSGGWQLTLIDANSIMNVGDPTVAEGSEYKPYTVLQAIAKQVNSANESGWVKGYMVGTVAPEVTVVSSNSDIEWSDSPTLANTLVVGQTPDTKDISECLVIELPQGSQLRNLGALRNNPDNYKKEIDLKGTFAEVMGTYGVTNNNGTASEFKIDGQGGSTPATGDGTEESPYTVAQIVAMNPQSTTESPADGTGVWVTGYIVGSMPTGGSSTTLSGTNFSTADAAITNIVIGPTADCDDYTKCIGIQLPTDANAPGVRKALNLSDNPGNLGRQVSLKGDVMKYCGGPGLKNTSAYVLGEGGGDTPVTPPSGNGDGTENNPYTASQVLSLGNPGTIAWVQGYIVGNVNGQVLSEGASFGSNFSQEAATNILIADNPGETNVNNCVPVQLPVGDVRTALNLPGNPSNVGKLVSLNGSLEKYFGVAGVKSVTAYKLDGSGNTPTPPAGDGALVLLGSKDANGAKDWTFNNVNMPSALSYIWDWKEYNSAYYLNASAYANGSANASEAWAISPVIDLTAATAVSVSFDHAAKFQTTLQQLCGFAVREEGASSWTSLQIPTWPAAGAWTFANSGSISLASYSGKKIQVAFKYGSSASGADTWEIRDLTFSGTGTITAEGASDPGNNPNPNPDPTPDPNPDPTPASGDGTFNFADPTTLNGNFSLSDEVDDGTTGNKKVEVKGVTFRSGEASIVNDGTGTGARLYHQASGDWSYRFYKNTATTISVADGYHIVKVTFTPQTTSHATALGKCSFSTGSYNDKVWTAGNTTTTSLTITDSDAGTVGVTKIVVEYAK